MSSRSRWGVPGKMGFDFFEHRRDGLHEIATEEVANGHGMHDDAAGGAGFLTSFLPQFGR